MAKQLSWQSCGSKVRVTFLATSRLVPAHFHADGSKVGMEPARPQAAHGSVLGACGLGRPAFYGSTQNDELFPPCTLLTLLRLADLVVVVLPWLKPTAFLVAVHAFSGFQPAWGLPETNAAAAGLGLARL